MSKPKVAFYWASSCGGCEIGVLAIHEKIIDLSEAVDIVFWPVAIDTKYKDVHALEDGEIDACFFNGAIRTEENLEMAELLRQKSKVLIAFGSCAHEGGIPGLANFSSKEDIFNRVYGENPSLENPEHLEPRTKTKVEEGELNLPEFFDSVRSLGQVVEVDYYMPGCPPVPEQIWKVCSAILAGELPERGAVVGVDEKTVCDQCKHEKYEKKIAGIKRPHEVMIDDTTCLLEQGVICMGPATRAGCDAQCIEANMPCRGCYGPPAGVLDQGAKMCSALASIIDASDHEAIQRAIDAIPDPAGTFYRFGLPASMLRRARV
jgi:F420-non-reducing hydrogenase small subunit